MDSKITLTKKSHFHFFLIFTGIGLGIYSLLLHHQYFSLLGIYFFRTLGLLLLFYGFIRKHVLSYTGHGLQQKIRLLTTFSMGLFFLTFSVYIMGTQYISSSKPPAGKKALIVLGAGLIGERVSTPLKYRLEKALEYYQDNPETIIVVAGGQGPNEVISEALAMKNFLLDAGVPSKQILMENKSTRTAENFEFSKKILDDYFNDPYETIFVTNDFHVIRSWLYGRHAGLDVTPLAAKSQNRLYNYMRDYLGIGYFLLIDVWL